MKLTRWLAASAACAGLPFSCPPRRPSTFDPAALQRARQDARLGRVRRPRPGDRGRDQDRRLSDRAVPRGGPSAGRRPASTASANGRRTCRCSSRTSSAIPVGHRSNAGAARCALTQGERDRRPLRRPTARTRSASPTRRWSSPATASPRPSATGTTSRARTCSGKIIVVLVNDPDFEGGEGDFGGKAMTYYGRWTYKYEEAARRGAAGVMIVHETVPASYGWATVKNSNTNAQFDIVRQNPAAEPHAVRGLDPARRRGPAVQATPGLDFEACQAGRQAPRLPADRPQVDVSVAANAKVEHDHVAQRRRHRAGQEISRRNGDLHRALGPSRHRQARCHAATASTMARSTTAPASPQLIEQGRAFAHGPRPDRSVVFMAVTAEEKGLLGSEYYATHPLYPLGKDRRA